LIENLDRLREGGVRMDLNVEFGHYPFFLAYQGCNDRDVMLQLAALHTPAIVAPRQKETSAGDSRPRIGFISRCFRHHTVGELMRGIIANLSRELFHVTVFSIGGHKDETSELIRKSADRFVEVSGSVIPGREAVASAPVDLLFYTDIGMDSVTYSLAFSRIAPVQCTTWGHPCTTGIASMDYYLSSELFEAEDGDEHYTEKLVRLKSIPAFCYRPELPAKMKRRSEFGFSDSQHIYACPQSLFKLRPDFDQLVAGILRRDPQGQVIFVDGHQPDWKYSLRERYATTIPDVANRIHFLPRMSHDDFLALNACCDVLIDPIHFNGGNTSYKALALGTPIVTLPMRLLRGRMTYALYKKMNMMDCVAATAEEYVDIAVRLGSDRDYRELIRRRILEANHVLYEDHGVVRELEQFFLQALAAKDRGD
jgi:predicted O-linked N-acetylglucosamine transferase (SPINDLY family)